MRNHYESVRIERRQAFGSANHYYDIIYCIVWKFISWNIAHLFPVGISSRRPLKLPFVKLFHRADMWIKFCVYQLQISNKAFKKFAFRLCKAKRYIKKSALFRLWSWATDVAFDSHWSKEKLSYGSAVSVKLQNGFICF
jgi:hypothetical protein